MLLAPRRMAVPAVLLTSLFPIAACGTDAPAVCSSVDDLSASIEHLGQLQLGENGRAQLESQLATVRGDLAQVRTDAHQQYGVQVATVSAAASTVRERFQAAKADPSRSTLQPLRTAVADLGTSVQALSDAVAGSC
jgi:uncharacterized protein YoxC